MGLLPVPQADAESAALLVKMAAFQSKSAGGVGDMVALALEPGENDAPSSSASVRSGMLTTILRAGPETDTAGVCCATALRAIR